jgi:uncharacterized membrane protein
MIATNLKSLTLSALLGAAAMTAASTGFAADSKAMDKSMDKVATEKCFGVAKAGKNDCAAGDHSCAGQSTKSMDKASFVSLPTGVCEKLAGGSLTKG